MAALSAGCCRVKTLRAGWIIRFNWLFQGRHTLILLYDVSGNGGEDAVGLFRAPAIAHALLLTKVPSGLYAAPVLTYNAYWHYKLHSNEVVFFGLRRRRQ
jgi:hypothetical protein